jgi:hypothetical protein
MMTDLLDKIKLYEENYDKLVSLISSPEVHQTLKR